MFVSNCDYEVLTPSGWSDFSGIKKITSDEIYIFKFDDGTELKCTKNHLIKNNNNEFCEANSYKIGDILDGDIKIDNILSISEKTDVYDLIDVKLNHEYFTNSVVSHNCAWIRDMDEIWQASQMTLATGGDCIILSTPAGTTGIFHQEWQRALEGSKQEGIVRFHPISLPWYLHPERNQQWRDQQDEILGKLKAAIECDCSFETSGHTVIEADIIRYYEGLIKEPLERRGIGGDLWIFQYPNYNRTYICTADVARGDGEDYSAFHVLDATSMEQVAEFKGKIDPQGLANLLISVATEYNNALLVVDNRNIGYATLQVIIDQGYKNLYYTYKNDPFLDKNIHLRKGYDLKDKKDMVPGYSIDVKTRPVMIAKFEQYFNEKAVHVYSRRFMNELTAFIWMDGKPQAQKGYNDDLIMALAIGLMVRDTSLKLLSIGVDLTKNALQRTHKAVFKAGEKRNPYWEQSIGKNTESLKWLL